MGNEGLPPLDDRKSHQPDIALKQPAEGTRSGRCIEAVEENLSTRVACKGMYQIESRLI